MEGGKDFKWHLTAIVVVGIWGMTFISTRVLIENGRLEHCFAARGATKAGCCWRA